MSLSGSCLFLRSLCYLRIMSKLHRLFISVITIYLAIYTSTGIAIEKQADQVIVTQVVKGKFTDVVDSLSASIQAHGANIAQVIPAQEILAASAATYNQGKAHFLAAKTIEFCSHRLSHALLNESPRLLVLCPFAISVYELPTQPGQIHLSYRNPIIYDKNNAAGVLVSVKNLMDSVIEEGTQWFAKIE